MSAVLPLLVAKRKRILLYLAWRPLRILPYRLRLKLFLWIIRHRLWFIDWSGGKTQ